MCLPPALLSESLGSVLVDIPANSRAADTSHIRKLYYEPSRVQTLADAGLLNYACGVWGDSGTGLEPKGPQLIV